MKFVRRRRVELTEAEWSAIGDIINSYEAHCGEHEVDESGSPAFKRAIGPAIEKYQAARSVAVPRRDEE